jgi:hypothetical protein
MDFPRQIIVDLALLLSKEHDPCITVPLTSYLSKMMK